MYDEDGSPPVRKSQIHYYGDKVRILFVLLAVLIFVAMTSGAPLPFTTTQAVFAIAILAISAGITNPEQYWINWINEVIAFVAVLIFCSDAINLYQSHASTFEIGLFLVDALAVLSLIALYYATKTIRGQILRPRLG